MTRVCGLIYLKPFHLVSQSCVESYWKNTACGYVMYENSGALCGFRAGFVVFVARLTREQLSGNLVTVLLGPAPVGVISACMPPSYFASSA